ncbi:MAG TPA: acetolactate synthase small subunit [Kofleriaceae bacterium]|nr:acetolactate synthase small subunit [Kofleriaceae bacterium]
MSKSRTFITYVEDRPGVLNRVVSLFRRRGYNIESLTVGRTARPEVSRITLVVAADDDTARRIEANLYKLVNVLYVADVTGAAAVVREMALIKVAADNGKRAEILQLCEVFRARVVDVAPDSLLLEATGAQDKIDRLVEVLRPFGLLEMVRTGAVAMLRGQPAGAVATAPEWAALDRAAPDSRPPMTDEFAAA